MGLLNILRRERLVRRASALIENNLPIENGRRWQGAARNVGRATVLDLWRNKPELARAFALATPALLAAGALAEAYLNAERDGDPRAASALHGTLLQLWLAHRDRFYPLQCLSAIDRRLFHQARSVLRASWIVDTD
ncbi:hypothetical protein [Variovorax sp. OV329]|uniref:hypothetical protein n=1 Tax=Variovorax sp. OV329 TaxID=1882825 RepID=UPI0008E20685|nr:hypothetical protein [Variovorax sp. OV329]SFM47799.1 hypothetical protein SAMN05444747_105393 [Variovorax sp. OV329]